MGIRYFAFAETNSLMRAWKALNEAWGYFHNFEGIGSAILLEQQVQFSPDGHNHASPADQINGRIVHTDAINKLAFDLNSVHTLWGSYFSSHVDNSGAIYALFTGSGSILVDGTLHAEVALRLDPSLAAADPGIDVNATAADYLGTGTITWSLVAFHPTVSEEEASLVIGIYAYYNSGWYVSMTTSGAGTFSFHFIAVCRGVVA